MAYSSVDLTTGAPIFADGDAPDAAVNPTQAAAYAAQVGNRLIGSNSDMITYDYARKGLQWFNTTDDILYQHDGSDWKPIWSDWRAYTPTLTNCSGGTVAAFWRRDAGSIEVSIRHTSPTITGQPAYSLPVEAANSNLEVRATAYLYDASSPSASPVGAVRKGTSTTISPYTIDASTTNALLTNISATAPFTWASGDFIDMQFQYRSV